MSHHCYHPELLAENMNPTTTKNPCWNSIAPGQNKVEPLIVDKFIFGGHPLFGTIIRPRLQLWRLSAIVSIEVPANEWHLLMTKMSP